MKRINIYTLKLVKEKSGLYDVATTTIRNPDDVYVIILTVLELQNEPVEKFGILALNIKNTVVGLHVISIGTIDATIVNLREIFKAALMNNASRMVLFHNHPSGDPTPSEDDIKVTKKIELIGEIMGVLVLDHVIIGCERFISLKESNYF